MKFNVINDDEIIVFLNKLIILDLDMNNEEKLEKYLKKIFLKLKNIYEMNVYGFYDLDIYKDQDYGLIIEINKDNLYSDYFNQVDMRITVKDTKFLYQINDLDNKGIIYKYRSKLYLDPYNKDYFNIGRILEHANIIYKDVDKILQSKIVRR